MARKNGRYPWRQYKNEIKRLYIDEGYTLQRLQDHFRNLNPPFPPSERAFKRRLQVWGFQKYKRKSQAGTGKRTRAVHSMLLNDTGLAHAPALPNPAAVPSSSMRSCTIQLNTSVDKSELESEPTLDQAENALLLLESLNTVRKLAQHGDIILNRSGTLKALGNAGRLVEDPGHAVWQQYLGQGPVSLSLAERLGLEDLYVMCGRDDDYVSDYAFFMRRCRWLIAMHDTAEQHREDSLQLCHEKHALTLSTLITVWDTKILTCQFPRLLDILSSTAQLNKNSISQQLKVMDQFLKIARMSSSLVDSTLADVPDGSEPLSHIRAYMDRLDSSALENQEKLLQSIEQVRVMIQCHFPNLTGNNFRPSLKSIALFLSDVRDTEFTGLIGLFFHHGLLTWITMLINFPQEHEMAKTHLQNVVLWLFAERLFTLRDELVRIRRAAFDNVPQDKWTRLYWAIVRHPFSRISYWIKDCGFRFYVQRFLHVKTAHSDSCGDSCNLKKNFDIEKLKFSTRCPRRKIHVSGVSISRSQTIPLSEHWCQCCMDEIDPDELCGRKFGPCCKGHMPPVSTTSESDSEFPEPDSDSSDSEFPDSDSDSSESDDS
ncbi:hypothetical protein BDZ91DRAFT_741831 [Kalaharituber pfeilii]|nr:hypothetical protein BDZ91DRAFT_741831 [Kalaharituber pfeilii]